MVFMLFSKVFKFFFRNNYSRSGDKLQKGRVYLEYYNDAINLGDVLSPVVCEYMLSKQSLSLLSSAYSKKPIHFTAIGSILGGNGNFDLTVWGSGIRTFFSVMNLSRKKYYQKMDIRIVRGPVTQAALEQIGIPCPRVYGDPAVLMPMIYSPEARPRKGTVLITHFLTPMEQYSKLENVTVLDIKTEDYKNFIDIIASAERVISSSLHGIILAEAYGTPAVFLKKGIEAELLKFYDWYYSTERYSVRIASDIKEALQMEPMPLPILDKMQTALIQTFPYDLWAQKVPTDNEEN